MRRARPVVAIVTVLMLFGLPGVSPAGALAKGADRQPVLREWSATGEMIEEPSESIGWSQVVRRSNGLEATVHIDGLLPDGVYTFWLIAVQDEGNFPDDIFVARGAGVVVGRNGKATVHASADLGDAGIEGFAIDGVGPITFASLDDPLGATVRIEIAYHGQAPAGGVPDSWLEDFWSGETSVPVCAEPLGTFGTGLIGAQPHCPVYFASTHAT